MSDISPTHIAVHQKSRQFEIHFNDGAEYNLPFEYLRVFSPSAEVRVAKKRGEIIRGKEEVNINNVEPMGSYAVRIVFDDGHHSGIYSWTTLKELGEKQQQNWQIYQQQLQQADTSAVSDKKVTVLFFIGLVEALGTEKLELELTRETDDVAKLIQQLEKRGDAWQQALDAENLTITVNRQFATLEQKLFHGDEVALVPKG